MNEFPYEKDPSKISTPDFDSALKIITLPNPTSQWNSYYSEENYFDKESLETLDRVQSTDFPFLEIGTEKISKIPERITSYVIYDVLLKFIQRANYSLYHFDIKYMTEDLEYIISNTSTEFSDWKSDIGSLFENTRKITTITYLSDPSEYEGGDIQLLINDNTSPIITLPKGLGNTFSFPSFINYRSTPITKGERKILLSRAGGNPFK